MKVTLKPEEFNQGENSLTIVVDIPVKEERLKLSKSLAVKTKDGEVTNIDDQFELTELMEKIAYDRIESVELVYDGVKYGKDDFFEFSDFQELRVKIIGMCIKGPTLSKKL